MVYIRRYTIIQLILYVPLRWEIAHINKNEILLLVFSVNKTGALIKTNDKSIFTSAIKNALYDLTSKIIESQLGFNLIQSL